LTSTNGVMAPAFYLIAAAVLSLLTVLGLRETAGDPLRAGARPPDVLRDAMR
jgi:MFS transporter, MHS family, proline/betaine transporter